jgi:phospholipase/carboxylesterase
MPAPRHTALGCSNGANIAAAVLLLRPDVLSGAILLRAMVPLARSPKVDLSGKSVLIVSDERDPIIPVDISIELATILTNAGANVQHAKLPVGHQLSEAERSVFWGQI